MSFCHQGAWKTGHRRSMKIRSGAWQSHGLRTRYRAILGRGCCIVLATILAGCEAPLDLSAVNAEAERPTRRADLFQAIARHADKVVVVGGMGAVVQSVDDGNNWQRTTLPDKPFLVDVAACPDGRFYAVEKTDGLWSLQADGSWNRQALPEMTEPQALSCDASAGVWVIGGFSTILHSVDGGANWDTWSLDEDLYLTTIQFPDRDHGVVTGEFGTVLVTADGGSTWVRASDLPDSFYPQAAWFASPTTGWVVGLNGTIWTTGDGAQSWQTMQNHSPAPLYGITGFDDSLLAVGENGTILHHRIGDGSWTPLEEVSQSRGYLRGVAGLGDGRFMVAGGGGALFAVTVPDGTEPTRQEASNE
jgi:photosystem II stability/assembly factor-like uncharacterized protein